MKTNYQAFVTLKNSFYKSLLKDYSDIIENARDGFKGKVHQEFWNKFTSEEHQNIQGELGIYKHLLYHVQDEFENNKTKDFEIIFNEEISKVKDFDKKLLLTLLSQLQAANDFIKYLNNEGIKYFDRPENEIKNITNRINWKGKIELEFIQLIYALYEGGYLSNDKNEITTLVKDVAEIFNLKLGKNWQSNLSKSVNNRKPNYKSEIFKKIEIAFEEYRSKQINKDK